MKKEKELFPFGWWRVWKRDWSPHWQKKNSPKSKKVVYK